jgi:hypothetical protein
MEEKEIFRVAGWPKLYYDYLFYFQVQINKRFTLPLPPNKCTKHTPKCMPVNAFSDAGSLLFRCAKMSAESASPSSELLMTAGVSGKTVSPSISAPQSCHGKEYKNK